MYTCPTDDIHSIYIDGELPSHFKKEYEEHITSCSKCKKKLDTLINLKERFKADSMSLKLDPSFMNASFSRLETKLHYSKNINNPLRPDFRGIVIAIPSAAACIALALVLPMSLKHTTPTSEKSVTPIERPHSGQVLTSTGNRVINGNINGNLAHSVSNGSIENHTFADVDVFRPEFNEDLPFPPPPSFHNRNGFGNNPYFNNHYYQNYQNNDNIIPVHN